MKVLHIVNTIRRGGAERQLATILQGESLTKNFIGTFYLAGNNYFETDTMPGRIYHVKQKGSRGRILGVRELIRETQPDILFAWGALPFCLAKAAALGKGIRVINGSIRHGVFNPSPEGYFRFMVLHVSRYVVANSRAGLRANRLNRGWILPNGIDERFKGASQSVSSKPRERTERITFISVANLVPYKDYQTVFKALSKMKIDGWDFRYCILGDGPLREQLESEARDYGISNNVVFLGVVAEPERYLAGSDVFIHSSKGEGCSNAILEAMYMGLPIVATETGGTPEILGKNAFLFSYRDHAALHAHLSRLAQDPELRKTMGDESYQLAKERFTVSRMIRDYERIIQAVQAGDLAAVADLQFSGS